MLRALIIVISFVRSVGWFWHPFEFIRNTDIMFENKCLKINNGNSNRYFVVH